MPRWKGRSSMTKQYKVGIYCRLSVEDSANSSKAKNYISADASVSIENQYEMLSKFTMLSGGNFQRPGFLEMLEDVRHGEINLILVKDLSRLGRDFVEVGRYTDVVFPALGCRFVSVLDSLDSEGDSTDMVHFRSLMNDYHLRDLSGKIKSVLHAKMRNGQYIAAYAPYGYRKSSDNKHQLVVDEEAAAVVQRIFDMRRKGTAYGKIAASLNREGILSPRWYWGIHYGNGSCKYAKLWTYAAVRNILNHPVYIGQLRQNTTGHRSYKDGTMIYKPKADWIIHEEAHEAIVLPEDWEAVQAVNRKAAEKVAGNAAPTPCLFSGKLVCADCGSPLGANRETQHCKDGTVRRYASYFCTRHSGSGRSACSWHRIYEMTLKKLVLAELTSHANSLALDEASVLERLNKRLASQSAECMEDFRGEIGRLRRRVHELEQMTAKLYEDKVVGAINADTFAALMQKAEQERLQKAERLNELQAEINRHEQNNANIQRWAALIHKYLNIQELDRAIVDELIDHIEIGERSVVNGQRRQDVKIYYRFVGLVD